MIFLDRRRTSDLYAKSRALCMRSGYAKSPTAQQKDAAEGEGDLQGSGMVHHLAPVIDRVSLQYARNVHVPVPRRPLYRV